MRPIVACLRLTVVPAVRRPTVKNVRDLLNVVLIIYALVSLWNTFASVAKQPDPVRGEESQAQPIVEARTSKEPIDPASRYVQALQQEELRERTLAAQMAEEEEAKKLEEAQRAQKSAQAQSEQNSSEATAKFASAIDPEIIRPEHAKLNAHLLNRFIVVPEYRLLFCYMEKVGCQSFNLLFRNLRAARSRSSLSHSGIWWQNTPQKHGFDKAGLERLLMDKTWHKAVFFRDPLERFLSAYRSKCEPSFHPDGFEHCRLHFGYAGKTFKGAVKWTINNHEEEYATEFDAHFKPMSQFCGGLYQSLHFYDTVEQLEVETSRQKVIELLERIGADWKQIQGFDRLYPEPKSFSNSKVNPDHQHNTYSQDLVQDFYGPLGGDLLKQFMEVYRKDYQLFNIQPRPWVQEVFDGRWVARPTTTRTVPPAAPVSEKDFPRMGNAVNQLPERKKNQFREAALQASGRAPDQQWTRLGRGCCATRTVGRLWSNLVGSLAECIVICKHFPSCGVVEYSPLKDTSLCTVWSEAQPCESLLDPEQCREGGNTTQTFQHKPPNAAQQAQNALRHPVARPAGLDWSEPTPNIWTDQQCKNLGFQMKNLEECKADCQKNSHCTAINMHMRKGCVLRECPLPVPPPARNVQTYSGYYMTSTNETSAKLPESGPTCFQMNRQFWPIIKAQGRTRESSPQECQQRCFDVADCMHFNYYADGKCELAPGFASKLVRRENSVQAGPRECPDLKSKQKSKQELSQFIDPPQPPAVEVVEVTAEPNASGLPTLDSPARGSDVQSGPAAAPAISAASPEKGVWVGIKNGIDLGTKSTGCAGNRPGIQGFICAGRGRHIHWPLRCGRSDFTIWSVFSVGVVRETGLSFLLWSAGTPHYIGLDGPRRSLFFEGGSWGGFHEAGRSPLKANVQYELKIQREKGSVKVHLNEKQIIRTLVLVDALEAASWTPNNNTIVVHSLVCTNKARATKPPIESSAQG